MSSVRTQFARSRLLLFVHRSCISLDHPSELQKAQASDQVFTLLLLVSSTFYNKEDGRWGPVCENSRFERKKNVSNLSWSCEDAGSNVFVFHFRKQLTSAACLSKDTIQAHELNNTKKKVLYKDAQRIWARKGREKHRETGWGWRMHSQRHRP